MHLQMIKTYGFVYMMMKTVQLETWFSKYLNLHFLLGQYLVTLLMYVSQISDKKKNAIMPPEIIQNQKCVRD